MWHFNVKILPTKRLMTFPLCKMPCKSSYMTSFSLTIFLIFEYCRSQHYEVQLYVPQGQLTMLNKQCDYDKPGIISDKMMVW